MSNSCEHGKLSRVCSECMLIKDIEKLEQENKELRLSVHRDGALEDIIKHNVELINKLSQENSDLKKELEDAYQLKLYSRRKLEQENKMMRECIEFVIANSGTSTDYNLKCRETLNKLTKDEK